MIYIFTTKPSPESCSSRQMILSPRVGGLLPISDFYAVPNMLKGPSHVQFIALAHSIITERTARSTSMSLSRIAAACLENYAHISHLTGYYCCNMWYYTAIPSTERAVIWIGLIPVSLKRRSKISRAQNIHSYSKVYNLWFLRNSLKRSMGGFFPHRLLVVEISERSCFDMALEMQKTENLHPQVDMQSREGIYQHETGERDPFYSSSSKPLPVTGWRHLYL